MPEQDHGKSASGTKELKGDTPKLYRYIQQIAQRLDLKLQAAYDWKELFDPETLLIRQKLRDACENLLFSANPDTARKGEEYLWRKAFYDIIHKFKQDKKALMKDEALLAAYDAHLCAAIGFYNHLLMRLHQNYQIPLQGTVDWFVDPCIFGEREKRRLLPESGNEDEQNDYALKACQRCLIYLGDLARYHYEVFEGPCPELAERYYYMAVILNPSYGMPHNQLGTLRQGVNYGCETVYHYMRCYHAPVSFDGAEENLKRTLDKHKQYMQQLNRERKLEQLISKDWFLCFFLKVQEHFYAISRSGELRTSNGNVTYVTDNKERVSMEEITQTGHQALFAFGQTLDTLFSDITKAVTDGETQNPKQTLPSSCLVKLLCICLMNTYTLKKKEIPLCTVALSFLIALATKLLEHSVRILRLHLGENNAPNATGTAWVDKLQRSPNKDEGEGGLENSPQKESSPEERLNKLRKKVLKMNKRKRRRRRRKRRQTHSDEDEGSSDGSSGKISEEDAGSSEEGTLSDLSEGELAEVCLSSDEGTSSEAEISGANDSLGSKHSQSPHKNNHEKASRGEHLTEQDKKDLLDLGAIAVENTKGDTKGGRIKQRLASWEAAVKAQPGVENLLEKAMEDMNFPSYLHELCYLPVVKVVFDWLRCNYKEFDFEDEVNKPLWCAVADFFDCLPRKELYTFAASHKRRILDCLICAVQEEPDLAQKRALPEDILVYGMDELKDAHDKLDFSSTQTATNTPLFQCIVRDRCIRRFVDFVVKVGNPFLKLDDEKKKLLIVGKRRPESEQAPKSPVAVSASTSPSSKKGETRAKSTEFMKALAKQKLEFDVSQLETTLQSTKISGNNLSAYLVMETQALCRHLSLIRSLLKSAEFVIIIPKQVVSALDDLKKYNPGAREAIKFLEEEFRRGNRWLKSQDDSETISEEILAHGQRRNKSLSVDDWRFFQIVRCACYFGRQVNTECLVSILTSDNFEHNGLGPSANRLLPRVLRFCQENGVQLQTAVDFYKRWTAVRK